ncbi:MAG: autotransporter outer membrane beta-barrel domain-containing protein, partial [Holosporales bacterium]
GAAVGADIELHPTFTLGLMAHKAHTKAPLAHDIARNKLSSKGAGLYASWHAATNGAFVQAATTHTDHQRKTRRTISFADETRRATAKAKAQSTHANITLGYDLTPLPTWQITPKLTPGVVFITQKAYTERNAQDISLRINRKKGTLTSEKIELDIAHLIQTDSALFRPKISLGYQHRRLSRKLLQQKASFVGGAGRTFTLQGGRRSTNTLLLGAGLQATHSNGLGLSINYQHQTNTHTKAHTLNTTILWKY